MYVCMYVYTCKYACVYVCTNTCMHVCNHYVRMYVYMYVCIYRGGFVIVRGFCPRVCPGCLSVFPSSFPVQFVQSLTSEFCNHN